MGFPFASQLKLSKSYLYGLFHRPMHCTTRLRCDSQEAEPDKKIVVQDSLSECSHEERKEDGVRKGKKAKRNGVSA